MIAFAGNGSVGVGELRKSTHVRTILIASCYTQGGCNAIGVIIMYDKSVFAKNSLFLFSE